jgi:hypothetical protein
VAGVGRKSPVFSGLNGCEAEIAMILRRQVPLTVRANRFLRQIASRRYEWQNGFRGKTALLTLGVREKRADSYF